MSNSLKQYPKDVKLRFDDKLSIQSSTARAYVLDFKSYFFANSPVKIWKKCPEFYEKNVLFQNLRFGKSEKVAWPAAPFFLLICSRKTRRGSSELYWSRQPAEHVKNSAYSFSSFFSTVQILGKQGNRDRKNEKERDRRKERYDSTFTYENG